MAATAEQQQTDQQKRRSRYEDREALKQSNLKELREMLNKMSKQLEHALPKFITVERMIRVATTTVQRNPRLLECHPITVVGAIMQSAALGLEPDNVTGSAYLVPFWNSKARRLECTLIPGYRGLMALARRSKDVTAFDAHVVKAGDLFDFEYGSQKYLRHKPAFAMALKEGKYQIAQDAKHEPDTVAAYMIAYYGNVKMPDGRPEFQFHVMDRAELERAKQFTTSRDRESSEITGPWIEHPDAMRVKTAIRRGCKLLPFSIELMTAVNMEERAIAGKSQNLGALVADDLGLAFDATDDDDGEGEAEQDKVDPELLKRIDAAFEALKFTEARKTTKLQEFRGRLPELLVWLEAEALKNAKPAGEGSTVQQQSTGPRQEERSGPPARVESSERNSGRRDEEALPSKPRASSRFRI